MESIQTENFESGNAEAPGKLAALAKCAHHGCSCTVESDEHYCSDYCMEQQGADQAAADDEDHDHACGCGHAECENTTIIPGAISTSVLA